MRASPAAGRARRQAFQPGGSCVLVRRGWLQLQAARDALEGKLQESTQFQQLRKLMQAKSAEVVELRKKLAKYEPQSIPSADD